MSEDGHYLHSPVERALSPPCEYVYDPYGGEPRQEDLDPDVDEPQFSLAGGVFGETAIDDTDNPTPYLTFRQLLLSMQVPRAPLPAPTDTSVKRWVHRSLKWCRDVREEDLTATPADAFSREYIRNVGSTDPELYAHTQRAQHAAQRALEKEQHGGVAPKRKRRPRANKRHNPIPMPTSDASETFSGEEDESDDHKDRVV